MSITVSQAYIMGTPAFLASDTAKGSDSAVSTAGMFARKKVSCSRSHGEGIKKANHTSLSPKSSPIAR